MNNKFKKLVFLLILLPILSTGGCDSSNDDDAGTTTVLPVYLLASNTSSTCAINASGTDMGTIPLVTASSTSTSISFSELASVFISGAVSVTLTTGQSVVISSDTSVTVAAVSGGCPIDNMATGSVVWSGSASSGTDFTSSGVSAGTYTILLTTTTGTTPTATVVIQ